MIRNACGRRNASAIALLVGKAALAAALIAWMVHRGKLNVADAGAALHRWPDLLGVAVLYYGCIVLMALRWHVLIRAEQIRLRFADTFALTMIGQLFNVLIPSSVGGDVIKAYYIAGRSGEKKTQAFATILVDRALGLVVLMCIASVGALWNLGTVVQNAPIFLFCATVAVFTGIAVAALVTAVVFSSHLNRLVAMGAAQWRPVGALVPMVEVLGTYRRSPLILCTALGVNLPGPVLATVAFALSLHALKLAPVAFPVLLLIVPLGLVSLAIPITPAGIGVGQAAFYSLFQLLAGQRGVDGSTAFTTYQLVMIAVYLSGMLFYLPYKRTIGGAASDETGPPAQTEAATLLDPS